MSNSSSSHSAKPRLSTRVILSVVIGIGILAVLAGMLIARWSNQHSSSNFLPTVAASPNRPLESRSASHSPRDESPTAPPTSPKPPDTDPSAEKRWLPQLETGPWPTSHVQGVAVDRKQGFIYYSFTTLLVKTDMHGELIGTVGGFTGHLGDLTFNQANGKVYGSLEHKNTEAFYIAIFDVNKIDREGIEASSSSIVSTVYLPEVVEDFTADLSGDGQFAGDTAQTTDHRYGTSGIDGIAFGPKFGHTRGREYLTTAYGIYDNVSRTDNDHQVLLQYDTTDWDRIARPLAEGNIRRESTPKPGRKHFVLTGNTRYGVQTLTYDPWLKRWFLGVYPGRKTQFPNYGLYAVDASSQPENKPLEGVSGKSGALLPLADAGLYDQAAGIHGWRFNAQYGLESLGNGLYYIARSSSSNGSSSAKLILYSWTGEANRPFTPVEQ